SYCNAGCKIEKQVAIHILDHGSTAPFHDERIDARVRRGHVTLVAFEESLGSWSRQGSLDARHNSMLKLPHVLPLWRSTRLNGRRYLRRQALGHLHLGPMVHCPSRLVGHRFNEAGGRRMTIAALFHATKGKMHLGTDAGQVDVTHTKFALFPKEPHRSVVFGNH